MTELIWTKCGHPDTRTRCITCLEQQIQDFHGVIAMMERVVAAHPCNVEHCTCRLGLDYLTYVRAKEAKARGEKPIPIEDAMKVEMRTYYTADNCTCIRHSYSSPHADTCPSKKREREMYANIGGSAAVVPCKVNGCGKFLHAGESHNRNCMATCDHDWHLEDGVTVESCRKCLALRGEPPLH